MAWTTPFTAVAGTAILASDWNTSGRDNLLDIRPADGQIGFALLGSAPGAPGAGRAILWVTTSGIVQLRVGASGGVQDVATIDDVIALGG